MSGDFGSVSSKIRFDAIGGEDSGTKMGFEAELSSPSEFRCATPVADRRTSFELGKEKSRLEDFKSCSSTGKPKIGLLKVKDWPKNANLELIEFDHNGKGRPGSEGLSLGLPVGIRGEGLVKGVGLGDDELELGPLVEVGDRGSVCVGELAVVLGDRSVKVVLVVEVELSKATRFKLVELVL